MESPSNIPKTTLPSLRDFSTVPPINGSKLFDGLSPQNSPQPEKQNPNQGPDGVLVNNEVPRSFPERPGFSDQGSEVPGSEVPGQIHKINPVIFPTMENVKPISLNSGSSGPQEPCLEETRTQSDLRSEQDGASRGSHSKASTRMNNNAIQLSGFNTNTVSINVRDPINSGKNEDIPAQPTSPSQHNQPPHSPGRELSDPSGETDNSLSDLSQPMTPLSHLSPKSEPSAHHNIPENPSDFEASIGPVRVPVVNIITKTGAFGDSDNLDDRNAINYIDQPNTGSYSPEVNAENQISRYGYDTIGKIVSYTNSNEMECRYLKTVNSQGQVIYIQPNNDSWMGSEPNDFIVTETDDPSAIPQSIRSGAFLSAAPDVYGVLLEKNGEICAITRSEYNMEPDETVLLSINNSTPFHSDNNTHDKDTNNNDLTVVYPIVRLSEITTDNDIVIRNTSAVTAKLRNTSYQTCIKNISDMRLTCSEFPKIFDTLYAEIDVSFKKLAKTIRELEVHKADFDNDPPTDANQLSKIPRIEYNLKRRHEMMIELLKVCHNADSHHDQLKQISRKLSEMTDHTRHLFEFIEYDLAE